MADDVKNAPNRVGAVPKVNARLKIPDATLKLKMCGSSAQITFSSHSDRMNLAVVFQPTESKNRSILSR